MVLITSGETFYSTDPGLTLLLEMN